MHCFDIMILDDRSQYARITERELKDLQQQLIAQRKQDLIQLEANFRDTKEQRAKQHVLKQNSLLEHKQMSILRRLKAEETKERETREQMFVERLRKMRWDEQQERLKLMDSIKVQYSFYF